MKKKPGHILLGCVADDFTGASDAASFLANQGIKTMLFNGIPKNAEVVKDCTAVVIALKTRSAAPEKAAHDTLEAFRWLQAHEAEQFYIKYCSTFDSTPKGNIGSNIDVVMENYHIPYTLLCPSLPVNNRKVKDGILMVDGKPIAEGHMANHPLNPIWDSRIEKLMEPQGKYPCMILKGEVLAGPKEDIIKAVEEFGKGKEHFYLIPDYSTDEEGRRIAEVFGENRLLTGGSGILEHMANRYKERYDCTAGDSLVIKAEGKGIALSGSCSTATCSQCNVFSEKHKSMAVYPSKLLDGSQTLEKLWEFAVDNGEVLLYSAGATEPQSRNYPDEKTAARASEELERTMAALSRKAFDSGYQRIIVAGGETSGAVALELGFDAFIIGESIAPGVPVMIPADNQKMRIVLKSGNFGQADFFERAFNMTRAE